MTPITRAAAMLNAIGPLCGAALGAFGGFGPLQSVPVGVPPNDVHYWVLGADFNADGLPDLLVVTRFAAHVIISNGDGQLTDPVTVASPGVNKMRKPSIADADGDGDLDLLLAGRVPALGGDRLFTYLNDGAAVFAPGPTADLGAFDSSGDSRSAAGDVDGDGDTDFILGTSHINLATEYFSLARNAGNGAFTVEPINLPDGSVAFPAPVMADWNADGLDDAAVATAFGSSVRILISERGVLTQAQSFPIGASALLAADFDADGDTDIACAGATLQLLFNDGTGLFTLGRDEQPLDGAVGDAAAADLDADGDTDIAVTLVQGLTGATRILLNDGLGAFASVMDSMEPAPPSGVALVAYTPGIAPDLILALAADAGLRENLTPVEPPGGVVMLSPPDALLNLPLPDNCWPGTTLPAFDWAPATGFDVTYTLELSHDPAFIDVAFQQSTPITTLPVPLGVLQEGATYYWRVTASNPAGSTPPQSGPFTFSIAPPITCPGDANADAIIDSLDLNAILSGFGRPCP